MQKTKLNYLLSCLFLFAHFFLLTATSNPPATPVVDGTVVARVWDDQDGNGRQNENINLEGVKVNLLTSSNAIVASATTNSSGLASFANVTPGSYKLEFVRPTDHRFTVQNAANTPEQNDSDAALNNGRTATFSLAAGEVFSDFDAGLWTPGRVEARVWDDRDGNGRQNEGSGANLDGVVVNLLNASNNPVLYPNGHINGGNPVTGVTSGGIALLDYVPADEPFKLEFELPEDHKFTSQNEPGTPESNDSDAALNNGRTGTFSADRGNQLFTQIDAGLWAPGTVIARVWDDRDGNGRQNENSSSNLEGVLVRLLNASNQPIIGPNGPVENETGTDGLATLDYVPADAPFKLEFVLPDDHKFTSQNEPGTPENNDSDAALNNGRTGTFSADRGSQEFTQIDAGLWAPGSVVARVWDDQDGNGRQNEGSGSNLEGVLVRLLNASNQQIVGPNGPVEGETGADGLATLGYVPADAPFKLEFVLPDDHKFTQQNRPGTPEANDSDAALNNGRTAVFSADRGSQAFTQIDAGLWTPGQVVAKVFEDLDGNGRQNEDAGVYGVRVNLLEANNQPVLRPNGSEVFAFTDCGTFEAVLDYVPADRPVKLEFVPASGAVFTQQNRPGTPESNDSDAALNNGRTSVFSADRGNQTLRDVDAGLTDRGDWDDASVATFVWNDVDNIGTQSGFERNNTGIAGVKVTLADRDGNSCICESTDASGIANLPAIAGRQYRLIYELPQDHRFTNKSGPLTSGNNSDADRNSGRTAVFNIGQGENITYIDAGLWAPGSVTTLVWNDIDNLGTQSGFEINNEGIGDVMVHLLESNGAAVINPNTNSAVTAMTDVDGVAVLDYVPADRNLRVSYDLPNADYKFTNKSGPITQGNNSDADRNSGRTGTFSLSKGSESINFVDAGMWAPGTVETLVWNDIDNIGTQSGFEVNNEGISGVTVRLLEANGDPVIDPNDGMPVVATTMANGVATLDYVP
ncbi:MAG: SdrD B-like domain-containing protein, partial [Bacteroidota bacterium]